MEVFVTPRAEKDFDSIIDYLRDKWGVGTVKEFIIKTDSIFRLLSSYPMIGQLEIGDIRGSQLSRQTRLLYTIKEDKIIVLSLMQGKTQARSFVSTCTLQKGITHGAVREYILFCLGSVTAIHKRLCPFIE